ncbi:MAG TPA: macro domain-containing protein [Verrucomicrobiae bacterium]|nr:macro domain-containing protein [Verrucomicrobiae bacterium]
MTEEPHIRYVVGDATQPIGAGNKIIAHVCNDIGAWGAGFVLAVSRRWPLAREAYLAQKQDRGLVLGTVGIVKVEDTVWVANMVGQHGIHSQRGVPPIRYDALRRCLAGVAAHARDLRATIHMPRIACGLAGGRWEMVEPLIREELAGLEVFVYDLPGTSAGGVATGAS